MHKFTGNEMINSLKENRNTVYLSCGAAFHTVDHSILIQAEKLHEFKWYGAAAVCHYQLLSPVVFLRAQILINFILLSTCSNRDILSDISSISLIPVTQTILDLVSIIINWINSLSWSSLTDTKIWVANAFLQLNSEKTEVLLLEPECIT